MVKEGNDSRIATHGSDPGPFIYIVEECPFVSVNIYIYICKKNVTIFHLKIY